MNKVLLTLVISFFSAVNAIAQEYTFYSNLMKIGRCGSNISGTPREIRSTITINETDNKALVLFEDGAPAFDLVISSVKHGDTNTGTTTYRLQNNPSGIHTLIVDRDPLRNRIVLVKSDRNCIFFVDLE